VVTTANLNLNYLRAPALGERLTARSKIEHLGRRTVSLTMRITTDNGACIAHGTATLIILQQPDND
jgi:acyl-CoA thioesterase